MSAGLKAKENADLRPQTNHKTSNRKLEAASDAQSEQSHVNSASMLPRRQQHGTARNKNSFANE